MNEKSLREVLADCTDTCGWCVHECPDEDKYDMLVTCISIQKILFDISLGVNLLLSSCESDTVAKILKLLEKLAEDVQFNVENKTDDISGFKSKEPVGWKMPGCSLIFQVAQAIEKSCLNESYNAD